MSKRLQRIESSKYLLYLNFSNHCLTIELANDNTEACKHRSSIKFVGKCFINKVSMAV